MSDQPGHQYIDRVGDSFHVVEADLNLTLIEVDERSTSLSLLFTGPSELQLEQATYTFRHADLGDDVIFIVALGPRGDTMEYEAVFTQAPVDDAD